MSSSARSMVPVSSVQDVVDAVRQAAADGVTLTAARSAGGDGRRLDLSPLARVVDYPARDMTVTVEAGMSLQTLSDLLAGEGQHLPVDVGDPQMSIGAFVASDPAGPRQYGYGTLRDYVIGLEAVDGQGRVFHAGGRVVKNVAGYDLCRLMTGSLGTLGILTQLTLKLKPTPEQLAIQFWAYSEQQAVEEALERLNESSTRPMMIDLEHNSAGGWRLLVGVEGPDDVVGWQLAKLDEELKGADATDVLASGAAGTLDYCREAAARHFSADTLAEIRTLPSQVPFLCDMLGRSGCSPVAHAGNGIILIGRGAGDGLSDDLVTRLRACLSDHEGYLQLSADRHRFRSAAGSYSRKLIDTFDPRHVFG